MQHTPDIECMCTLQPSIYDLVFPKLQCNLVQGTQCLLFGFNSATAVHRYRMHVLHRKYSCDVSGTYITM